MTRSHVDTISAEINRVFASVHMSEPVSSTHCDSSWSCLELQRPRNKFHDLCLPHHRWRQSRPTFAAERTQNQSASSAQWDTFEEVVDTEEEDSDGSDTIDPGDLQEYVRDELEVLATCMDIGENDTAIPGVDNSQLETACLKLAELPEALASVQAARRGASDSNPHSRASPGGKGKTQTIIWTTTCAQQSAWISDRMMTDQLKSSEELNDLGHSLNNAEAQICKRSWTNEKHAASVMRVVRQDIGRDILNAQVVLSM